MKALLTLQIVCTVDDEEEAGSVAIAVAEAQERGIAQELEKHPEVSRSDLSPLFAVLGCSVSIIPEEVLA